MKVCLVVSTYEPDTLGGQGEVVLKLQKEFLGRSVDTYVLTSGRDTKGYPQTVRTGSGKRMFYAASVVYFNWIRRMDFDVINIHHESGMSLAPLLIASKCRAKIVTTLHNSYLCESRSIGRLRGFRKEYAHPTIDEYASKYLLTPIKFFGTYVDCAVSDKIVAVSVRTGEECKKDYRLPEEKVSVIHNGIDLSEFNPQLSRMPIRLRFHLKESPVILAVGAGTIRKGMPYLLQAMVEVRARIPGVRLIIAGSRRYQDQMESFARDLGIQQNVIFAGPVGRDDLPYFYSACDIVAVPSSYEGFPIVVLEALASGRPVVASRVGGIPEAIRTGANGVLIDPGDVSQLSQALIWLLENEPLRREMGLEARRIAESRFDWRKVADEYLRLFDSLL